MGIKGVKGDTGPPGSRGDAGDRGPQGIICIYLYKYTNVISGNCMYVLLGDPGYPGPIGLRGESGQKGNHNTRVMCYCVINVIPMITIKSNLLIKIKMMPACVCFKL